MSLWSYINGTVVVSPIGRTQPEKRYILDTVIDHLPIVTGSERDMNIYVIQKNGTDSFSTHDEFFERTNNLITRYGKKSRRNGLFYLQSGYILVVNGAFRDRDFDRTFREFSKWICRLAKRVMVEDVIVEIRDYYKSSIIRNENDVYGNMFESPSWLNGGEPTWCEYLLWETAKGSGHPMKLAYKYFNNEENDNEFDRRVEWRKTEK